MMNTHILLKLFVNKWKLFFGFECLHVQCQNSLVRETLVQFPKKWCYTDFFFFFFNSIVLGVTYIEILIWWINKCRSPEYSIYLQCYSTGNTKSKPESGASMKLNNKSKISSFAGQWNRKKHVIWDKVNDPLS